LFVAKFASGLEGRYVPKNQAIDDFAQIISGAVDHLPEEAFYMVGTLEEAQEKAKKLTGAK